MLRDLRQRIKRRTQALGHPHFVNNGSQKGKTKKDKWLTEAPVLSLSSSLMVVCVCVCSVASVVSDSSRPCEL